MSVVRPTVRRRAGRSLALLGATVAVLFLLSLTSLSMGAHAASPDHARRTAAASPADTAPAKAVVVVGPVGGSTASYLSRGRAIASAAESHGMEVVRIFTPNATWRRVAAEANGASLFVYLGHGNGWPSPHPPFQEDTKDGLGLNPVGGTTDDTTTKYYGADWIREHIRFAANAVVLLNGLCYADGNGEAGMPIPSRSVAIQRVDNFASGFLASGARVVFALGWQPGTHLVETLFADAPTTMDGFFETRFGSSMGPYSGWIGWKPDLYADSARTPGARLHLDPDPQEGYLRAVSGDLEMSTEQWRGDVDTGDTEAPVVSGLRADQPADTLPAGEGSAPTFTPNGDGLSDTITLGASVSEAAFLAVGIRRVDGDLVRHFTRWAEAGDGTFDWDGRDDSGTVVPDGRYEVTVTPRDRAGNVGEGVSTGVRVLTSMKAPVLLPILFHPQDGDGMAQTSKMRVKLIRPASLTWRVTDRSGAVVRRGPVDQPFGAGFAGWAWDGRDDAGALVPTGVYTSVVTATTDAGTYSHRLNVRAMPFDVRGKWKVATGQRQTLTVHCAEPIDGRPVITVRQPGMTAYALYPVRSSATEFTARWTVRAGDAGKVRIIVSGTDTGGGSQSQTYLATLQ